MLPGAEIQVPFLADLVTLADPASPYTFLNYLHAQGRLFRFYFHEHLHVLRAEYEAYCRWVAARLSSCRFSHRVDAIRPVDGGWAVWARGVEHRARQVVLGVGCVPWVPDCARGLAHSADYLAPARRRAAGAVGDRDRLRPERGGGLRRPARARERARRLVHAQLGLLADGVLQARPGALLTRIHRVLPRAARGAPRRAAGNSVAAEQGDRRGASERSTTCCTGAASTAEADVR